MKRMYRDLIVIAILLGMGGYLLWVDSANIVIIQALVIGMFMVAGTHLTRRLLLPQIDLQLVANKASIEPIGAAIVFAAILLFLVSVMWLGISVLK